MDWDGTHWIFLLGMVIIIISLMARVRQRLKQNAQRQAQKQAQIEAAHIAERRRQKQTAALPKSSSGKAPSGDRLPMPDPFGTLFTGGIPTQFARWETELHKLGRQITAQIDSKMAALQAITQDANRTATRLEILVEHLDEIAKRQIETAEKTTAPNVILTSPSGGGGKATAEKTAAVAEAVPLAAVLKDLHADLDKIHQNIRENPLPPEIVAPVRLFRPVSIASERDEERERPHLPVRQEVAMLADYGYETDEIAKQLNISTGEVDLILQVQGK